MSPLGSSSIRSIKPISFASSMQRAKEEERSRLWSAQLAKKDSHSAVMANLFTPAQAQAETTPLSIFPRFSTVSRVQMEPPRSALPARVQDYAAMAALNEEQAIAGPGKLFDMHA